MMIHAGYKLLPEYDAKQAHEMSVEQVNQEIGKLETTAKQRFYTVKVLSCCLSPITCFPWLFIEGIFGIANIYLRNCNKPQYSTLCVPVKKWRDLLCAPLTPVAMLAEREESFLLPPEKQAMEKLRKKLPEQIRKELEGILNKTFPAVIVKMIFEYQELPKEQVFVPLEITEFRMMPGNVFRYPHRCMLPIIY